MKPIILISSCKRDIEKGYNDVIRRTWGKISVIPYRFFIGDELQSVLMQDEVSLDCPDNYYSLPLKTALSVRWALQNGYTHAFRAFTDTYVDTGRLLKCGFEDYEYMGNLCGFYKFGFMHGGPGYWLGPTAMQVVGNEFPANEKYEDQWVGRMMRMHNYHFQPDFRFSLGKSYEHREQEVLPANDIITEHLSTSVIYNHKRVEQYSVSVMEGRHLKRFPKLDSGQSF